MERASEHPIAAAIATAARERLGALPPVTGFANTQGRGVTGQVEGHTVLAGRASWLDGQLLPLPAELARARDTAEATGRTVVFAAWDDQVRAALVVADTVKATSAQAIADLKQLGLTPVLLTGDNTAAARAVAAEVGIDQVIAEVHPEDKVAEVRRLHEQGHVVAMVGDGVNDAAVLAQADLGLAMGTGTDAAIAASDLTLVRGDLRAAGDAIRLARRTLRTIKANLFWAFAYNIAALPLAVLGMLNPMIAGPRWPPRPCSSSPTACGYGASSPCTGPTDVKAGPPAGSRERTPIAGQGDCGSRPGPSRVMLLVVRVKRDGSRTWASSGRQQDCSPSPTSTTS